MASPQPHLRDHCHHRRRGRRHRGGCPHHRTTSPGDCAIRTIRPAGGHEGGRRGRRAAGGSAAPTTQQPPEPARAGARVDDRVAEAHASDSCSTPGARRRRGAAPRSPRRRRPGQRHLRRPDRGAPATVAGESRERAPGRRRRGRRGRPAPARPARLSITAHDSSESLVQDRMLRLSLPTIIHTSSTMHTFECT